MSIILLQPGDLADVSVTWDDLGTSTISGVTYSGSADLTLTAGAIAANVSTVRVSGQLHGRTYQVIAEATLSNGQRLRRTVPIRCLLGA